VSLHYYSFLRFLQKKNYFLFVISKIFLCFLLIFLTSCTSTKSKHYTETKSSQFQNKKISVSTPKYLDLLIKAYPDVSFVPEYDKNFLDWKIHITVPQKDSSLPQKTSVLYWAEGRFLPPEKMKEKELYEKIFYFYPENIPDPKNFTKEQIKLIKESGETEIRKNNYYSSPHFLFDAIYDSITQESTEANLEETLFLSKNTKIHYRIQDALKKVEKRILNLSLTNQEVKEFVDTLLRVDGFSWREIRDSPRKSFHSFGIAIDLLPKGWGNKIVYWNWEKHQNPEGWMLTPLSKRWIPPLSVINIFEEEGFIWGGKWNIWDNMHFEYRPELILYSEMLENK